MVVDLNDLNNKGTVVGVVEKYKFELAIISGFEESRRSDIFK
jgi:hypothetical protein